MGENKSEWYIIASSQAKGTKSTSFLTRKERSGLSTLGMRRCMSTCSYTFSFLLNHLITLKNVKRLCKTDFDA